jgi:hypothetical protein
MNARLIIIRGIPTQDPAQVRLPEYDQVVETFPADRADQSTYGFCHGDRGAVGLSRMPMARKSLCGARRGCLAAMPDRDGDHMYQMDRVYRPSKNLE